MVGPDKAERIRLNEFMPTITQSKEMVVISLSLIDELTDKFVPDELKTKLDEFGATLAEAWRNLSMRIRLQFSSNLAERVAEPSKMGSDFRPGVKATLEINALKDFADVLAFIHPSAVFFAKMLAGANMNFEIGYNPAKVSELVKKAVKDSADDDVTFENDTKKELTKCLEAGIVGLKASYAGVVKKQHEDFSEKKLGVVTAVTTLVEQVAALLNGVESIDVGGTILPFDAKLCFDDFDPFCVMSYVLKDAAETAPPAAGVESGEDWDDMDLDDAMGDLTARLACLVPLFGLPVALLPYEEDNPMS
jgi:hypothetical protein